MKLTAAKALGLISDFNFSRVNAALWVFLCHADMLRFYRFDLEITFESRRKSML